MLSPNLNSPDHPRFTDSRLVDVPGTADHSRFTDARWVDLPGTGLTRETAPHGWDAQFDLAVEGFESCREWCPLTLEDWRTLVSAAASGFPVRIVHGDGGRRTSAVYLVSQFLSIARGTTANLYVRTWGFSYPLSLRDLRSATVPATVYGDETPRPANAQGPEDAQTAATATEGETHH